MAQPAGTCRFPWTYFLDGVAVHRGVYELKLEADETRADGWVHRVVGVRSLDLDDEDEDAVIGSVELLGRHDPLAIFIGSHVKRAAEDVHSFDGRRVFEAAMENIGNPHTRGGYGRAAA